MFRNLFVFASDIRDNLGKIIWKNFAVIAAIMLLGFLPSQLGMWLIEHEGWAGKVFGHHGADLDAVSSKFLIVGGGVWLWILLDSIWLRWFNIHDVLFGRYKWGGVEPVIRAAAVLGWFLAFMAVVLGFTQGLAI